MKNRNIVSVFILVFIILGLFAACPAPNPFTDNTKSDSTQPGSTQPGSTDPGSTQPGSTDPVQSGPPILVAGTTLADKFAWLNINAKSDNTYILEVTANESLAPQNLSYTDKSNIVIQLKGSGNPTISLSRNGPLFQIDNSVTLILEGTLTLLGRNNNSSYIVQTYERGTLIMNQGVKITGNSYTPGNGICCGGVAVGGTFTMNGGEISGNTKDDRGGGGGVSVWRGTFTMNDGKISGNVAGTNTNGGGGVYVTGGTFTMNGGEISGNSTVGKYGGGGVLVEEGGTFTMSGGEISANSSGNESDSGGGGGGVCVWRGGTFTMSGGEISGNTLFTFRFYGSTSLRHHGGGVLAGGPFTKSGGTITGYANDTVNGNVVKLKYAIGGDSILQESGHAVYADYDRYRDNTAEPKDNLDSRKVGTAGGWVLLPPF